LIREVLVQFIIHLAKVRALHCQSWLQTLGTTPLDQCL